MAEPNLDELIQMAFSVQKKAYAPYSNFKVGAALLTTNGKVFSGCNVENSSYGLSICAERNAVGKAVGEGESSFKKVIIVTNTSALTPPCGACRQFLYEFAPDLEVIVANHLGEHKTFILRDLLPNAFDKNTLDKARQE